MADTQPLAPTDDELDELRQANSGRLNFVTFREFRVIARAVLAKWGAPAPVRVEPLSDDRIAEMVRDTWGCASIAPRHAAPFARAVEAEVHKLYPAPQPVVREPLIRQMRNALSLPCDRWNATQSRIVREAIAAADAWLEGN